MALFGPYVADVKGNKSLTAIAQKEACPREEIADSPGTNMFSTERHVFVRQRDELLSYQVE